MRRSVLAITSGLAISCVVFGSSVSANADSNAPMRSTTSAEYPSLTTDEVSFEHPVKLQDAVQIRSVEGRKVVAYHFDNGSLVGEYSPANGVSPEQYAADIHELYGTEPAVTSVVVTVPVAEAEVSYARGLRASKYMAAPGPEFTPAPVDRELAAKTLPKLSDNTSVAPSGPLARAAARTWKPDYYSANVFRLSSSTVYFGQAVTWNRSTPLSTHYVGSDATLVPSGMGLEFEINITTANPAYQYGVRTGVPSTEDLCPSFYKDQPAAKNYNWTWSAYTASSGPNVPVASSVGAYADYNDLSDPCNKNSMAIGMRYPQNLPSVNVNTAAQAQAVSLMIQAPRGTDSASKASGLVQSVSDQRCRELPWMALTDCMGVVAGSAGSRTTLGASRGWSLPDLCWVSGDYGLTTASTYRTDEC